MKIEVEEDLYTYEPADNGAGPQWCFGSTTLARVGENVFASGLETIPGVKPLNNTRLLLFRRTQAGPSQLVFRDPTGRTREPGPIGVFPDGRVFLTTNPTLTALNTYDGPARPEVLEFSADRPTEAPKVLSPSWDAGVTFNEHSYRTFTVDGPGRRFACFNNIGYDLAHWSFYDGQGHWPAHGTIHWPRTQASGTDVPLRVCYPSVGLRGKAVHFFGVSDIVEPNTKYREFKRKLTNREWDYIFCRVFYSWTPDLTHEPFRPWVEVGNCEETRGWLNVTDLWLGPDGTVHLLWFERTMDERLREAFFPQIEPRTRLQYAQVKDGRVALRRALLDAGPGSTLVPRWGRFHATPSGRLLLVATVERTEAGRSPVQENQVMELGPDGTPGEAATLPLEHSFSSTFFTATPRGGSAPSAYLDLLGECAGRPKVIRYARVRVE